MFFKWLSVIVHANLILFPVYTSNNLREEIKYRHSPYSGLQVFVSQGLGFKAEPSSMRDAKVEGVWAF